MSSNFPYYIDLYVLVEHTFLCRNTISVRKIKSSNKQLDRGLGEIFS